MRRGPDEKTRRVGLVLEVQELEQGWHCYIK